MVITFIILVWRTRFPLCCPLPPVLPWRAPPPPPKKKGNSQYLFHNSTTDEVVPRWLWDNFVSECFVFWSKSWWFCTLNQIFLTMWMFYWRKFCNSKSFSPALSFTSCHGPTRKRIDPAENIKEIQTCTQIQMKM